MSLDLLIAEEGARSVPGLGRRRAVAAFRPRRHRRAPARRRRRAPL